MLKSKLIELVLEFASWQGAQEAADKLLALNLITSAEFIKVASSEPKQPTEDNHGVGLIMQTNAQNLTNLRQALKQLSSGRLTVIKSKVDIGYNSSQNNKVIVKE